jgi:hypothetical protein
MDLFCPHCSRRVTVPDDQAGKVMSCPLCTNQFMAPSLAPPPVAPKPPAPPVSSAPPETYGMGAAPAPLPGTQPAAAPKPASASSQPAPAPASAPPPPPPPGDYSRSCALYLNDTSLAFVPPACVLLIFVLSFFTWHVTETTTPANFWVLFWSQQLGHFLAYFILMILSFPLVFLALVFDKGWIFAPPQLAPIMTFKNLIISLLLGIAFLLLCYDYLDGNLLQKSNPIAWPMKVAIRLHLVAVFASFLMFWLTWRKKFNLPLPKCEVRW